MWLVSKTIILRINLVFSVTYNIDKANRSRIGVCNHYPFKGVAEQLNVVSTKGTTRAKTPLSHVIGRHATRLQATAHALGEIQLVIFDQLYGVFIQVSANSLIQFSKCFLLFSS